MRLLLALTVFALTAGTSFADPTTADLTIQKGLTSGVGWGIVNPASNPPLVSPTNIWPDKGTVGKMLDKAATNLGATTFTCTVVYDPDFQIPGSDGVRYLLVTKLKRCDL